MTGAHLYPTRTGTRWPRTFAVIGAAVAALVGLTTLMSSNVLALDLVFGSTPSQFSSSEINASNVAFAMATAPVRDSSGNDTQVPVLRTGLASAKFDGLCVSHTSSIAGQTFTFTLTAGDGKLGSYDVSADNAIFDAISLKGGQQSGQPANGVNLDGRTQLGVASSSVTTVPGLDNPLSAPTGTGWYGIDAGQGRLYSVKGQIYDAQIQGPLDLPDLKISVSPGIDDQCQSAAYPK